MPMYLAEISSNQIRGLIGVITIMVLKGGVLFVYSTVEQYVGLHFYFQIYLRYFIHGVQKHHTIY